MIDGGRLSSGKMQFPHGSSKSRIKPRSKGAAIRATALGGTVVVPQAAARSHLITPVRVYPLEGYARSCVTNHYMLDAY